MNIHFVDKGWFMFTKQKCSYCTKAKAMLPEAVFFECDTILGNKREDFLAFVDGLSNKKPRTFPMIFYDGQYMGGYTETNAYLESMKNFELCDF